MKVEDILQECLERVLERGETVESCLSRYPSQAQHLEPLLRLAWTMKKASALEPRPEFKASARYQALSAFDKRKTRRRRLWVLSPASTGVLAALVIVLAGGSGTVVAARGSLPGDELYPVKMATEKVWSSLTLSSKARARLEVRLAKRRVQEMTRLAEEGHLEEVEGLVPRLAQHLEQVERFASAPGRPEEEGLELRTLLERELPGEFQVMEAALKEAPGPRKPALKEAIKKSRSHYQGVLDRMPVPPPPRPSPAPFPKRPDGMNPLDLSP